MKNLFSIHTGDYDMPGALSLPRGKGAVSYREAAYELNSRSTVVLETLASRRNEN